jgi:ribosomal small subunit protein bTHX
MGKGDIKTKRGKITNGTFGKLRKHKAESVKVQKKTEEPDKTSSPEK